MSNVKIVKANDNTNKMAVANSILDNRNIPPTAMIVLLQIVKYYGGDEFRITCLNKRSDIGRDAIRNALRKLEQLEFLEKHENGKYAVINVPFIKCA